MLVHALYLKNATFWATFFFKKCILEENFALIICRGRNKLLPLTCEKIYKRRFKDFVDKKYLFVKNFCLKIKLKKNER